MSADHTRDPALCQAPFTPSQLALHNTVYTLGSSFPGSLDVVVPTVLPLPLFLQTRVSGFERALTVMLFIQHAGKKQLYSRNGIEFLTGLGF